MQIEIGDIFKIVMISIVVGSFIGWNIRNIKVKKIFSDFALKEANILNQAKTAILEIKKQRDEEYDRTQSLEKSLKQAKIYNDKIIKKLDEFEISLEDIKKRNKNLYDTYTLVISKIKQECALLPSVVDWSFRLQEAIDNEIVDTLVKKDRPARKTAEVVKEARAAARNWKKEAEILRNMVSLYEAEAPWLLECVDYSVDEIINGLRQEFELQTAVSSGNDPAHLFVSVSEWSKLTKAQRNQLALDRYWEYRQRNAWAAGIQYERYVGYSYEKQGFSVVYQGATKGFSDLGIDLVCAKDGQMQLVQCKRLSVKKAFPVRENAIAQIFGASLYYAYANGIKRESVTPVIVTTYELSEDAKKFAVALGVRYREHYSLEQYPCIKCNISVGSGERIYHLPFDQQYDVTRIDPSKGECYVQSVMEAERLGFRRASKWLG